MYEQLFGLSKCPFNLTPDPTFLFLTPQHREALVGLTYAILKGKGFVVLTGEAGTGKTTLLVKVLQSLPAERLQFSKILNPTLNPSEFLEMALLDFGITDVPSSKARRLSALQNLLFQGQQQGKVSALIVDEAHKLNSEVLEEIRLLGNFERADRKLLQIVLVGQSELEQNLDRDDLQQLKQRIALWLRIEPLCVAEVGEYMRFRWETAGGTALPFSTEAIATIAKASFGIPRVISSLCDNSLMLAFGEGESAIERRHVVSAAAEMKLGLEPDISDALNSDRPVVSETAETGAAGELAASSNGVDRVSLWAGRAGRLGLASKE